MPTKHIEETVWRRVEKLTVHAVQLLERPVKDTDVLQWVLVHGLTHMNDTVLENFAEYSNLHGRRVQTEEEDEG